MKTLFGFDFQSSELISEFGTPNPFEFVFPIGKIEARYEKRRVVVFFSFSSTFTGIPIISRIKLTRI
ncbi:MAG: hypothetical protein ACFE95_04170 [Candidatus Hodarchaeota archaeon]